MTGKTAIGAVARGVYALMAAQAALTPPTVPGGISDHTIDPKNLPAIWIGNLVEKVDDAGGTQARVVEFDVGVASAYAGLAEALGLLDTIAAVLHRTALTLTGWTHDGTFYDGAEQMDPVEIDASRLIQTIVGHFRVFVVEA